MHRSKMLGYLGLFATFFAVANSAKILAIHGTELNSHYQVFRGVVDHLAPHHNITFYLFSNFKYNAPPNVEVRYMKSTNRIFNLNMTDLFLNPCQIDSSRLFQNYVVTLNKSYFEETMTSINNSIFQDTSETYDLLIMTGYGAEHLYQLPHIFGIPVIQVLPSVLKPWHNDMMMNPHSWVNDFSFIFPGRPNSFWKRLQMFVRQAEIYYHFYWKYIPLIESVTKKFVPSNTPSILESFKSTELILVNTHNVMGYSRPNLPTIIEIGGQHIKPSKKLPADLEEFVSGSDHGFIYFSLGSTIPATAITEKMRRIIINVFRKLPQRILWKWNGQMANVPSNVKILKWLPQGDILAHKNIKLFITQGGMLSMQESVYHGVPTLVMPLIFDQYNNAFLAQERGYGKYISFCQFNEEKFRKSIRELLINPKYSETVKKMSKVMKHQNKNLSSKLNWWIDFIIQNNGTEMLKPSINYQSWLDVPIDITLFFVFVTLMSLYLLKYLFMYAYILFVQYSSRTNKNKSD